MDFGRFKDHKRNLYNKDWEYIDAEFEYPTVQKRAINRPKQLEQMLKFARTLSENIPFLRTDFYSIEEKIYFGEITFFPESGFGEFRPVEWNIKLGEWIELL